MNDRRIVVLGTLLGAAAGLAASYFLYTEEGRRLRADLEPEVDRLAAELGRLRGAFDQMRREAIELVETARPRRSA